MGLAWAAFGRRSVCVCVKLVGGPRSICTWARASPRRGRPGERQPHPMALSEPSRVRLRVCTCPLSLAGWTTHGHRPGGVSALPPQATRHWHPHRCYPPGCTRLGRAPNAPPTAFPPSFVSLRHLVWMSGRYPREHGPGDAARGAVVHLQPPGLPVPCGVSAQGRAPAAPGPSRGPRRHRHLHQLEVGGGMDVSVRARGGGCSGRGLGGREARAPRDLVLFFRVEWSITWRRLEGRWVWNPGPCWQ